MAMKKSLIEIVQEILSDLDSQEVNSISDTLEAEQIARIVESVYYSIINARMIPEHKELIKLTSLSDSTKPTHFEYPENVKEITDVWYDKSSDSSFEYDTVKWCDPVEFLYLTDKVNTNYTLVTDVNAGTSFRIVNNKFPTYYTSFDDQYIVMNSYKSTIESTLQESKTRAYGIKYPVFDKNDDNYIPDLDATIFPYLIAEAKSTAFSILKGGSDPKVEQNARRQKSHIRNDMYRTSQPENWSIYGRT